MMRARTCKFLSVLFCLLVTVQTADASIALTAGSNYSGSAAPVNFNVSAGTAIDVPIALSEYGTTKEISSDGGLDAAGFLVTHQTPSAGDDSIIVNAGVNLTSFPDVLSASYADTSATVTMDVFPKESLTGTPASVSQGLMSLGTVSIQAASTVGQVSTYMIQDVPGSYTFLTDNGNQLDGLLSPATFAFTVTATPEPACLAVLLTISALLLSRGSSRESTTPCRR